LGGAATAFGERPERNPEAVRASKSPVGFSEDAAGAARLMFAVLDRLWFASSEWVAAFSP
jgi:hypothetical protein